MTANQMDKDKAPGFGIQRVYIKDLSFEAPQTPEIFQQEWQPELDMQLNTDTSQLADGVFEVTLKVTVTATSNAKTAFLVEVAQAGIFELHAFPKEQIHAVLGTVCPSILFPYARELITSLVSRGTFPPLYLAPVNFDALYAEHLAKQQDNNSPSKEESESTIITH